METALYKLSESGVYLMTDKLLKEVMRLQEIKKKNECQVPAELLQTKYKNSYDRLCAELKEKQCQLRTVYVKRVRILADILANSVYADDPKEFLEAIKEQYKETMLPDNLDVIFLEAFEDYLDMIKKAK